MRCRTFEPEEAAHTVSRIAGHARRPHRRLARLKPYADVPEVRELLTRYPMSA
ncbi:hypothetical protein ACFQVD_15465 [Streptosporangium amethystogenes subsp. fukuiense]|uniref:Transposase n=1 Tax=Streptosporangium amethystogenes subsp. fukuiense TaxID=698418 RepID=A0ABW2SZE2_9ACTN